MRANFGQAGCTAIAVVGLILVYPKGKSTSWSGDGECLSTPPPALTGTIAPVRKEEVGREIIPHGCPEGPQEDSVTTKYGVIFGVLDASIEMRSALIPLIEEKERLARDLKEQWQTPRRLNNLDGKEQWKLAVVAANTRIIDVYRRVREILGDESFEAFVALERLIPLFRLVAEADSALRQVGEEFTPDQLRWLVRYFDDTSNYDCGHDSIYVVRKRLEGEWVLEASLRTQLPLSIAPCFWTEGSGIFTSYQMHILLNITRKFGAVEFLF